MWKQWLSLPFFWLKVLWAVSPTLFSLLLPSIRQYGALALSVIFLVSVVSLLALTQTSPLHKLQLLTGQISPAPPPTEPVIDPTLPWKRLHQLQPRHRDILINLSLTLQATKQPVEAQLYLEEARHLDPNFSYFTQP